MSLPKDPTPRPADDAPDACCYGMMREGNQHSDDCDFRLISSHTPREVIDEEARKLGLDPDRVRAEGRSLVQAIFDARRGKRNQTDYERGHAAGREMAYRTVLAHLRASEERPSYKDTVKWLEGMLPGFQGGGIGTVTTPSGETIGVTEVELKPMGVQVEPPPTVGRIVHYYPPIPRDGYIGPYAAIITYKGEGGRVALSAFVPYDDVFITGNVPYALTPTPGCWSWPPRS